MRRETEEARARARARAQAARAVSERAKRQARARARARVLSRAPVSFLEVFDAALNRGLGLHQIEPHLEVLGDLVLLEPLVVQQIDRSRVVRRAVAVGHVVRGVVVVVRVCDTRAPTLRARPASQPPPASAPSLFFAVHEIGGGFARRQPEIVVVLRVLRSSTCRRTRASRPSCTPCSCRGPGTCARRRSPCCTARCSPTRCAAARSRPRRTARRAPARARARPTPRTCRSRARRRT